MSDEQNLISDNADAATEEGTAGAPGVSPSPGPDVSDPWLVELARFSGPLELLLHLIKKHEMDIFDIPIALITEKYLNYVQLIQELDLERAGDFLVMAATLAHIKSKMLLPPGDEQEDEEVDESDPREELVRRLLEYQKYKIAAEQLASRPILGRDLFARPPEKVAAPESDEVDIEDVSVFQLIEIFQELLDNARQHAPHQVQLESVSVDDKVFYVLQLLKASQRVTFRSLFRNVYSKPELVATFLAILELARLHAMRIYQTSDKGEIYLSYRSDAPSDADIMARVAGVREEENGEVPTPTEN